MDKSKALQSLGLCMRANKLVSGETFVLEAIRKGTAKLVLLADDAGPNTSKGIADKSTFYNIKLITGFSSDELSQAIGKKNRKAVAVIDKNFARMIESHLGQ